MGSGRSITCSDGLRTPQGTHWQGSDPAARAQAVPQYALHGRGAEAGGIRFPFEVSPKTSAPTELEYLKDSEPVRFMPQD